MSDKDSTPGSCIHPRVLPQWERPSISIFSSFHSYELRQCGRINRSERWKRKKFDIIMSGFFSSSFQAGCQKSPCDYYKRLLLKLLPAENLNKFSFTFVESKELETVRLARRWVPWSSECSQLLVFQTGALSTLRKFPSPRGRSGEGWEVYLYFEKGKQRLWRGRWKGGAGPRSSYIT